MKWEVVVTYCVALRNPQSFRSSAKGDDLVPEKVDKVLIRIGRGSQNEDVSDPARVSSLYNMSAKATLMAECKTAYLEAPQRGRSSSRAKAGSLRFTQDLAKESDNKVLIWREGTVEVGDMAGTRRPGVGLWTEVLYELQLGDRIGVQCELFEALVVRAVGTISVTERHSSWLIRVRH